MYTCEYENERIFQEMRTALKQKLLAMQFSRNIESSEVYARVKFTKANFLYKHE
jgi:hypothetical protein